MTKSPIMKVKLGYWDGKFDCEIYSPDGKMLFSQETHPNSSPVELIPNVEKVLIELQGNYKLVVATKGDLKDQHRKLHDSGIGAYFHHIEVMSDKKEIDYQKHTKEKNNLRKIAVS